MTEKIFLSYAHEDRDLVKGVLGTLRKHRIVTGNDVVILDPHDFVPGTDGRNRSSTFGTVNSARDARIVQLGMKVIF